MGQFKNIDIVLRQIADDTNVHPSIRDAMRNTSVKQAPVDKVYLLLCDGNVTDVFTDKDMAMYGKSLSVSSQPQPFHDT